MKRRRLTAKEIDQIRRLSKTKTLREISKITGWQRQTIRAVQMNPKNNIKNPYRKVKERRARFFECTGDYFDINAWAKEMNY